MRKSLVVLVVSTLVVVFPVSASALPTNKFKNCDALRAKYSSGVAVSAARAGNSGAIVNRVVYNANKGLDRDKDGIACER